MDLTWGSERPCWGGEIPSYRSVAANETSGKIGTLHGHGADHNEGPVMGAQWQA